MAVAAGLARDSDAHEVAWKMTRCAYRLRLAARAGDVEAQELLLQGAYLCQQRLCPFCEWRRVRRWRARLIPGLQAFHLDHPKHSALFLTLTVRNVPLENLREGLKELHKSWNRLTQRNTFPTQFWIRRTELTIGRPAVGDSSVPTPPTRRRRKGQAGAELTTELNHGSTRVQPIDPLATPHQSISTDGASAPSQKRDGWGGIELADPDIAGRHWIHPHIHALLLVPARYWKADYIRQSRWREMWMESAKLDYAPVVDVRRARAKNQPDTIENQSISATIETAKYMAKHSDLLALGPALGELHFQLMHTRMTGISSALQPYVKADDPVDEELLDQDALALIDSFAGQLYVDWNVADEGYVLSSQ